MVGLDERATAVVADPNSKFFVSSAMNRAAGTSTEGKGKKAKPDRVAKPSPVVSPPFLVI